MKGSRRTLSTSSVLLALPLHTQRPSDCRQDQINDNRSAPNRRRRRHVATGSPGVPPRRPTSSSRRRPCREDSPVVHPIEPGGPRRLADPLPGLSCDGRRCHATVALLHVDVQRAGVIVSCRTGGWMWGHLHSHKASVYDEQRMSVGDQYTMPSTVVRRGYEPGADAGRRSRA